MGRVSAFVLLAALVAGAVSARMACAQSLEIISLHFLPAEQLVPQLRPLLETGASLTGTGGKLFLRTSAGNLAEIRRVIAELDREPRRLVISVRHGGEQTREARGMEVSGDVGFGRNVRVIVPGQSGASGMVEMRRGADRVGGGISEAHAATSERIDQQVQTMEGGSAWIEVGRAVPLPQRQTVRTPNGVMVTEAVGYREVGTGFFVAPRLAGDRVTLDISPHRDVPGALPGSADIQRVSTAVSGRLGEWIELGGIVREESSDRAASLGRASREARDTRGVWVKVEELR